MAMQNAGTNKIPTRRVDTNVPNHKATRPTHNLPLYGNKEILLHVLLFVSVTVVRPLCGDFEQKFLLVLMYEAQSRYSTYMTAHRCDSE